MLRDMSESDRCIPGASWGPAEDRTLLCLKRCQDGSSTANALGDLDIIEFYASVSAFTQSVKIGVISIPIEWN